MCEEEDAVVQLQLVPAVVLLAAAMVAAATDVWKYKIHNALTLPLLLTGLIFHAVSGGAQAFSASLLGALFGFTILLVFYIMGGMGAGDVKLMAAVGAWLGMPLTFYVFIASSLAAGLYAVILLVVGQNFWETWVNFQLLWIRLGSLYRHLGSEDRVETEIAGRDRRLRVIPFAAMVVVGLVATLIWVHVKGL
jgi:prepilin peptidase CpaA